MDIPKVKKQYRHISTNNIYVVIDLTNLSSTNLEKFPPTVVYRQVGSRTPFEKWSRPIKDFLAKFERV